MRRIAVLLALAVVVGSASAQAGLRSELARIAAEAKGTVGVACALPGTALNCDLNAHEHAPMQSMYKLPLAMTALDLAERGKLLPGQRAGETADEILDTPVRFLPSDRIANTWSPMAEKYPEANVELPLREVVRLAVAESDNDAEEMLVRLVGGAPKVGEYLHRIGIRAVEVRWNERDLDRNEQLQYEDWIEPVAAVDLLEKLANDSPLSAAMTQFLLRTMESSRTGLDQMRAGLPEGTVLAHKTGHSGVRDGVTAATNDIGLITLPDGRKLALAIYVTDSRADDATRNRVMAGITRAVYAAAVAAK